ncbi:DUF1634 domain-containing protein [Thermomicrobium sp. CFH 73360]|uniref:DUF1634 domain-containing protein n=1 Tax=Thermomicrobium sp. CFH 73360 TaxID=2951987 RepID=UPI00207677E3|nr:DUF1634 domain-containing protein [Thermomicrobium sp. CFH 73360]MCM8745201.1 DUF1634 domain-containing protein [Thermomicrobium sp. CFH 73360]
MTAGDTRTLSRLSQLLARLYRFWLALALLLLSIGTVLDLVDDRTLATETVPLADLPRALIHMDPAAFESLALLIVAFGPVAGLLTIIVSTVRQGDRRTAGVAVLLLVVVAVLPIVRSLGGR